MPCGPLHRQDAGEDRRAIHEHRAGTALSEAATELWSMQSEVVAQHVKQGRIRADVHCLLLAVHIKRNHECLLQLFKSWAQASRLTSTTHRNGPQPCRRAGTRMFWPRPSVPVRHRTVQHTGALLLLRQSMKATGKSPGRTEVHRSDHPKP